ncbi:MAG: hypothetical protein KME23_20155 [Goleter apudmare HA4340-LM2]|jgi:uncharacterized protein (DUF697 family)|nr:hypothetical protein [Goleter apudmare HA4340-LM2]
MVDNPQKEINSSIKPSKENTNTQPSAFQSFANNMGKLGGVIKIASQAGKTVLDKVVDVGTTATQQTHQLIEKSTQASGRVINYLSQNWLIRKLSGFLNLNWLIGAASVVDVEKAAAAVKKLKQEHPHDSPSQIAHRIMVEKATKAGSIGLATSILPGFATALLAIDLAATTELQSEMLYQIAAAYGLDLKDPARKGEMLAIFGLGLGGGRLLKAAGLGLLRNVPFAGAAIAVSSNATMIYSLGYAACRFYEVKVDESTSLTDTETIEKLRQQSADYLETAIAQKVIMDKILVHMILASHPEKTWAEILPELKAANLSETSLAAITEDIKAPQPLDSLLNQLNRDFAIPLLVQCRKIAQLDTQTTPEEQKVINAIAAKFNLENGE